MQVDGYSLDTQRDKLRKYVAYEEKKDEKEYISKAVYRLAEELKVQGLIYGD